MRNVASVAAIACMATLGTANAANTNWMDQIEGVDANARLISPGVMVSESGNSTKVYASGIDGMRFMRDYYSDLLTSVTDREARVSIQKSLTELSLVLNNIDQNGSKKKSGSNSTQASESGNPCGADYDISATATNDGFWYIEATASAGYQQHHPLLGPKPPWGPVMLGTFATSTSEHGSNSETDTEFGEVLGYDYISADTSHSHNGVSANCMTAEASASIIVQDCPSGYRAVSESFEMHCN
jgi:hypothetical protein